MSSRLSKGLRHQQGVSLVELMIAMVIGLILMLGVIQIFAASQTASRLSEGVSRTQENARFALDFLERDIRMAGHMGCVNDQAHIVKGMGDPVSHLGVAAGSGSPLDFGVSIQGYEAPGSKPGNKLKLGDAWQPPANLPAGLAGLGPAPVGGSDILVLRYLSAEGVPVNQISLSSGNSTLTMEATRLARVTAGGVTSPKLFGIADCSHADIFQGTLGTGTVTATGVDLTRYTSQPTGQTMLYRAESLVYYVGNNPETGLPGLRRARARETGTYGTNEEVVEGIQSLQLLYGLDTTTAISTATPPAGNITDVADASTIGTGTGPTVAAQWLRVGQVKVGLLAVSPMPSSSEQPVDPVSALGVSFDDATNNDGRYRTSYEVTIALRNRLFGN